MIRPADSVEAIAWVRTPVSAAISSRGPMLRRTSRRAMSSANGDTTAGVKWRSRTASVVFRGILLKSVIER